MRKIFFVLAILLTFSIQWTYAATSNNSPIVQIISYDHDFWKFFELKWWGSASIISKDGYILTNNHVVDDGKWGTLDFFNICISENDTQKPNCYYTATLVSRDTQKDIAILRINDTDIYWKKVDTSEFQTIEPDFNYTPKSGDQVEAIGYPWVWSETITKTQWIISGTSRYNNATYLKTDTLIAWWNSGWALIKDGKLIWIPTFWIGWWTDTSLWYALLAYDAKDFIETNIKKTPENIDTSSFNNYKKQIEEINQKKQLKDNFISLDLWDKYKASAYITDRGISLEPASKNEDLPQSITIGIADLPQVKTQDDFFYYVQKIGLYNKEEQKLKKTTLWWIDFYTPVGLYDSSWGDADTSRTMFGMLENKMIIIHWEFGSAQENTLKRIQSQFNTLAQSIDFNKTWIKNYQFVFNLPSPQIAITKMPASVLSETSGFAILFPFNDLHEHIAITISELDVSSWKGKSVTSIYDWETKDIDSAMKSLILYKWHPWFIYCVENASEYQNTFTDEKWNSLDQSSCQLRIYELKGENNDFKLNISLVADKENIVSGLTTLINSLDSLVSIPSVWDGKTTLTNIYNNQVKLNFTDIGGQPEWYINKLKTLVKYEIIDNETKLNPYSPVKWWEFMNLYFSSVYKFDLNTNSCDKKDYKCRLKSYKLTINKEQHSLAYILDKIGIRSENYVNQDKLLLLPDTLDLLLFAQVSPEQLTEEMIKNYTTLKNQKMYEEYTKKIETEDFNLYGNKKITLDDINQNTQYTSFNADKWLYYIPKKCKIIEAPFFPSWKLNFSRIFKPLDPNELGVAYPVSTKASMIDFITGYIDFWLFDPDLAKRKNTNVEG